MTVDWLLISVFTARGGLILVGGGEGLPGEGEKIVSIFEISWGCRWHQSPLQRKSDQMDLSGRTVWGEREVAIIQHWIKT